MLKRKDSDTVGIVLVFFATGLCSFCLGLPHYVLENKPIRNTRTLATFIQIVINRIFRGGSYEDLRSTHNP